MSFMSIPTILREDNDGLLAQKDDAIGLNIRVVDSHRQTGRTNSVYSYNQFEEEGHVERFQCHFSLLILHVMLCMPWLRLPFTTDHNWPRDSHVKIHVRLDVPQDDAILMKKLGLLISMTLT